MDFVILTRVGRHAFFLTHRSWKTGRPDLLLLARQGSVHFHDRDVVLKEAEAGRVAVVLSKDRGVGR